MTAAFEPVLRESLTLGIDLGIASCGWAMIEGADSGDGRIIAMGVRCFDAPETAKERTPTNQIRRQNRLMRRVIKRRRQRMNGVRALLKSHGLLTDDSKKVLAMGLNPWTLRAEALNRPLEGPELAVALGHIAKHRGFKSNSKRDRGKNANEESSKMLGAIERTREHLKDWRTVGEMFAKDATYAARKRNRDGNFDRSILRDDLEREVVLIFDRQRRMGNAIANPDLQRQFIETAFFQRPLQDSDDRVGFCPFESDERRAAKHSPSFERFRLASRLCTLSVRYAGGERTLTAGEISLAMADFGAPGIKLTYKRLRGLLKLGDGDSFDVPREEEGKREIASRSSDQAAGTKAFRNVLGDAWKTLLNQPDKVDRAAAIITFREAPESIRKGLEEIDFEPLVLEALMKGVVEGDFATFRGAGHISAKAARNILPHLMRGLVYSEACTASGYDHARRPETDLSAIGNPVARKALGEAVRQVRAIVREYGLPGAIHIELARDVGKSKEERDKITSGIEKRNKAKDRLREEYRGTVGREAANAEDLLRFELWKEQAGRCFYSDSEIHPDWIVSSDNRVQVDHILPWSRSGDDSFINKTLCIAKENQDKKGLTPFEWFKQVRTEEAWEAFATRVETNKAFKGRKKRNYLLRDAKVLEEKFRPRNLTDTQYATRLLADMLRGMYPVDGSRRVFTRPGALTDRLRRAWGVQGLKKDKDGKRIPDDRHHALDALIVAATTEGALNRLTRAAQIEEERGSSRFIAKFPMPWPNFKEDVDALFPHIFVSRAERGRVRGEAHAATIRAIGKDENGPVVHERKSVETLNEKDLDRIKDAERNHRVVSALRDWVMAGKPKDRPPLSPKGDPIRKVSLTTNKKADVLIRDGAADRGEMVRVDVFRKPNRRGTTEYFLVPVYPHQVASKEDFPQAPSAYVRGGGEEEPLTADHEFLFSLSQLSFLEIEKQDGTCIHGYFRALDRNTGAIKISPHDTLQAMITGIGARSLKVFRKFQVDRLGRRHEIQRETRTWRGVACT
ncbi:MAG: type II CRISPR RNA-guided endonuclease Cas9 [Alphaproteobacteria bacterium]|nr:type II CRISPR RNA-guided endonuclease Cas9 [Alphaproteobacteria bacterium]MCW5743216.1 type II CRISPR RNA-guided endonuclease Cas9 [Alphaproteobacteria bacterium]